MSVPLEVEAAHLWVVYATVQRIIDGDTFVVDLDLGWRTWLLQERIRIAKINAPELSTPEGKAARTWAQATVPVGTKVKVTSHTLDKYGRALCDVTLPDGTDYGQTAIMTGHAVTYP